MQTAVCCYATLRLVYEVQGCWRCFAMRSLRGLVIECDSRLMAGNSCETWLRLRLLSRAVCPNFWILFILLRNDFFLAYEI